jgi:hypothetical protein
MRVSKVLLYTIQAIIVTIVILTILYFLLMRYDRSMFFLQIVETYPWYLVYFSISMVVIYIFSMLDFYLAGRIIRIILFSHVLLWFVWLLTFIVQVPTVLLIILVSLLIVDVLLLFLPLRWWRSVLVGLISFVFMLILAIAVLPPYKQGIDMAKFYDTKNHEIYVYSTDAVMVISQADAELVVNYADRELRVNVMDVSNQQVSPVLQFNRSWVITFLSRSEIPNTAAIVHMIDGKIFAIPAQSQARIFFTGMEYGYDLISIQDGSGYTVTWFAVDIQNFMDSLRVRYEQDRLDYVVEQLGGVLRLYPGVDNAIAYILSYMAKLYPLVYAHRWQYYQDYHQFLVEYEPEEIYGSSYNLGRFLLELWLSLS